MTAALLLVLVVAPLAVLLARPDSSGDSATTAAATAESVPEAAADAQDPGPAGAPSGSPTADFAEPAADTPAIGSFATTDQLLASVRSVDGDLSKLGSNRSFAADDADAALAQGTAKATPSCPLEGEDQSTVQQLASAMVAGQAVQVRLLVRTDGSRALLVTGNGCSVVLDQPL